MTAPLNTPVFNCVVNVAARSADGLVVATVANLAGLASQGNSEREALAALVSQFKTTVARHHRAGTTIPWIDPPVQPAAGETQRLIAVHL